MNRLTLVLIFFYVDANVIDFSRQIYSGWMIAKEYKIQWICVFVYISLPIY